MIPGSGRPTGEGIGYALQYSGLENSMNYSPWGHKESDTTEQVSLFFYKHHFKHFTSIQSPWKFYDVGAVSTDTSQMSTDIQKGLGTCSSSW